MKRPALELWVGLFALVGLGILGYFTFRVGSSSLGQQYGLHMHAYFEQAPGVEPRTPVKLAGVKVGEVQSIRIERNKARLDLLMRSDVPVPIDTRAEIRTQGLIGETYVHLQPGADPTAIADGGEITNVSAPVDIDALLSSLGHVGDDVQAITASLREVIASEQTEMDLKAIIANVRDLTEGIDSIVDLSEKRIDAILGHVEALSGETRAMVGENREDLRAIIANFRSVSEQIDTLLAANEGEIGDTMTRLRGASERLESTLASAESIMGKIDAGEGTIGRLINDDTITVKVEEALDSVTDLLDTPNRLRTTFGYRFEYFANADDFRNMVSVRIQPREDRYYLLEIVSNPLVKVDDRVTVEETTIEGNPPFTTDDPPFQTTTTVRTSDSDDDNILFSAQIAQRFEDVVLRGGLIESSAGVGADVLFLDDDLRFSADFYDFNPDEASRDSVNLKLWAHYTFFPGLHLTTGVDDLLNEPTPLDTGRNFFVGAGFEFGDDDLRNLLLSSPLPIPGL